MEIAETYDYISSERQVAAIKLVELLSPQQKRVLAQVAKGYRNKQIAHNLQISVSTVKMHRAEVLAKMNLSTSAEAIGSRLKLDFKAGHLFLKLCCKVRQRK